MFILTAHLLVTLARLARPGGFRAVAAESLAVKHQLLIMKRSRQRAPNLTSWDRLTLGFCALFVSRERLSKMAVILKASTLLYFHQALVKRKYYLLYNSRKCHRPGPKESPQNARLSPDAVRITTASARGPQIRLQPVRAGRARDSRKLTSELTWLRNRSQCDVASRAAARPG